MDRSQPEPTVRNPDAGAGSGSVLAIETTGSACSVALVGEDEVLELTRIAPRRHNALVLEMVDGVMAAAAVNAGELEGVAFSAGPGSFTGVRIGAAIAQGVALGGGIPAIPVPTSEVAAEQVRRRNGAARGVVVARGARAGWVYAARYRFVPTGVECQDFDMLVREDALPVVPAGWLLVRREQPLRAAVLGVLARPKPKLDPDRALPLYVDGDSPWRKMDRPPQDSGAIASPADD